MDSKSTRLSTGLALITVLGISYLFCWFLFIILLGPQFLGLICWAFALDGPIFHFAFGQAPVFTFKNAGVFVWIESHSCPLSEPFHFWKFIIGCSAAGLISQCQTGMGKVKQWMS